MPRRPKPGYLQTTGQPHSALHYPERYGLTYEQALAIVESKKWKNWYIRWRNRKAAIARIEAYHYTCPRCKQIITDLNLWQKSGRACNACSLRKPVAGIQCDYCLLWGGKEIIAGLRLCKTCQTKLATMVEMINGCEK